MLTVRDLMAGYNKVMIIREVNIDVQTGEIVAIIGRNGVGKSTLMKALTGIIQSKAGSIRFNGEDVTRRKSFERAREGIGYVPQGHGVFPQLTVAENLKMGYQINLKSEIKYENLVYDYFPRLRERRSQKAGTLSGGEQAMLAIGRALVGNPKLLLLDEPSEGIQPNIVHQIGGIIKLISTDLGLTVLFVEQHIGLIQQMANRCYAIDKGTIVGELNQEQLLSYDKVKTYLAV